MLTLTENASTIVQAITSQLDADGAGLRITTEAGDEPSFGISASEQPEAGDQVVEQSGATVYLESAAAEMLDDKVLDAAVDEAGNVQFAIGLQG